MAKINLVIPSARLLAPSLLPGRAVLHHEAGQMDGCSDDGVVVYISIRAYYKYASILLCKTYLPFPSLPLHVWVRSPAVLSSRLYRDHSRFIGRFDRRLDCIGRLAS